MFKEIVKIKDREFYIESDGIKCFVNSPHNVARFCKLNSEYLEANLTFKIHNNSTYYRDEWQYFKSEIFKRFELIVTDRHKPDFVL